MPLTQLLPRLSLKMHLYVRSCCTRTREHHPHHQPCLQRPSHMGGSMLTQLRLRSNHPVQALAMLKYNHLDSPSNSIQDLMRFSKIRHIRLHHSNMHSPLIRNPMCPSSQRGNKGNRISQHLMDRLPRISNVQPRQDQQRALERVGTSWGSGNGTY